MEIQVGRTYLTRDGERVKIVAETDQPGTYRMRGIILDGIGPGNANKGAFTWRSRAGRFTSHPHRLDLVSETA